MVRWQLAEIHEQACLPDFVRNLTTDALQGILSLTHYERAVAPLLQAALEHSRSIKVVDLCSGAGGPWPRLIRCLEVCGGNDLTVCLTDKFPNYHRFAQLQAASQDRIDFWPKPVEANQVPAELRGFRTLFNSLHHFPPQRARSILEDAVQRGEGLAIFELPRRHWRTILRVFLVPLAAVAVVPFLLPFRLSLFSLTYLLPLVPFILWFDGIISCLRAYTPAELQSLAAGVSAQNYQWKTGVMKSGVSSVTYLLGYPTQARFAADRMA